MRIIIILMIGFFPFIVSGQVTLDGNPNDTTYKNPDLKDVYTNEEGKVEYYLVKDKKGQTTSLRLQFENNETRQLYITVDKNGNLQNVVVVENKSDKYEVEFIPKKRKIKSLKSIFFRK